MLDMVWLVLLAPLASLSWWLRTTWKEEEEYDTTTTVPTKEVAIDWVRKMMQREPIIIKCRC